MNKTRVLLVGYGFMGKTHAAIYEAIPEVEVVAIVDLLACTSTVALPSGKVVPVSKTLSEALASYPCDMVDLCVPTDLHVTMGLQVLGERKHLFCEKPIALDREGASQLEAARQQAGVQAMVGHCIRFWPEYRFLKDLIGSKKWGALQSLSLRRYAARPRQSAGSWVEDPHRCKGAALDLHIHDTDYLLSVLGKPFLVTSRGVREESGWNWISTDYAYEGVVVHAEGGWNLPENWPFEMSYRAVFTGGVVDFSSNQTPTLRFFENFHYPKLKFTSSEIGSDSKLSTNLAGMSGYYATLAYFIGQIQKGLPIEESTLEQATQSLEVTLAEIQSAEEGRRISI